MSQISSDPIRGLSLTQPWASLMARGAKRIETRSWSTKHRGLVAIHASKSFPLVYRHRCVEPMFRDALGPTGYARLPRGAIVAVGCLVDCCLTQLISPDLTPLELAFGDYEPGRYAWMMQDVVALKDPVPCKGHLGLWTMPDCTFEPRLGRLIFDGEQTSSCVVVRV